MSCITDSGVIFQYNCRITSICTNSRRQYYIVSILRGINACATTESDSEEDEEEEEEDGHMELTS